ncbi:hypothetical protein C8J56DRAFT_1080154 [Mycena floridula]|nr:hypothetical protein C8J56DRAFT_1080154 [Mycena floridula]
MNIVPSPSTNFMPGVGAVNQVAAVSNLVSQLQNKVIDLLEKKSEVQTRADDLRYEFSLLKEQNRKTYSKLDSARDFIAELEAAVKSQEKTISNLNAEISEANERINDLSNKLENRGHLNSPKRRRKELASNDNLNLNQIGPRESKAVIASSYLPLLPNVGPVFAPIISNPQTNKVDKTNATLNNYEIITMINTSPSLKYLTMKMSEYKMASFLLYHAGADKQYKGVDITVNGNEYSICLRQTRGLLTLLHICPRRASGNASIHHKLTAEFSQLIAIFGKYENLLTEMGLINPDGDINFTKFPAPPVGVSIDKKAIAKHLYSCNVSVAFVNDIFPFGRQMIELQQGKQQPTEEAGSSNQVRESEWAEALNASNMSIALGLPPGRAGVNVLFNTVPIVPICLRPGSQPKKPNALVYCSEKPSNAQVDVAMTQLGVISFSGLPSFIDKTKQEGDSTGPVFTSPFGAALIPDTGNAEACVDVIDEKMVDIKEVIDTKELCGDSEAEEDDFGDAMTTVGDESTVETPLDIEMNPAAA